MLHLENQKRVIIVGAGTAGLASAILLAKQGYSIDLFEYRKDPRKSVPEKGNSINFTLSNRGAAVLKSVGVLDEVIRTSAPLQGRVIHLRSGQSYFQPYGNHPKEILYAITRAQLGKILLNAASKFSNIHFHFEHKCIEVLKETAKVTLHDLRNDSKRTVEARFVVGADGAFSSVRSFIQKGERANYSHEYSEWGYKELNAPPTQLLNHRALHLWPRGDSVICGIPNPDQSVTCTLILPFKGSPGLETLKDIQSIEKFMNQRFSDLLPLIPNYQHELLKGEANSVITTSTSHWYYKDKAVILGDACHAVSPFIGQGMNAALEDSLALCESISANPDNLDYAFSSFQNRRTPEAAALRFLSKQHLLNLRKNLGSAWNLAQVHTELFLNRIAGQFWVPLYTLVAHTSKPYTYALRRAAFQKRVRWFIGLPLLQFFFWLLYGFKTIKGRL